MKLSVSLSEEVTSFCWTDVWNVTGFGVRGPLVFRMHPPARKADLQDAYAEAWSSWDASEDATVWDSAVADGIDRGEDATR